MGLKTSKTKSEGVSREGYVLRGPNPNTFLGCGLMRLIS